MSDRDLSTSRKQVFGTVERGTDCRVCGRNVTDGRSVYCSDYCSNLADAVMGMLNWGSVRRRVVERDDHTCQVCGFDRRWIDCGRRHIEALVRERLSDPPGAPSALDIGRDEVTEEDWQRYWEEKEEWEEEQQALYDRFGNPYKVGEGYPTLEVDHINPIFKGGHPFDPANLRTLCTECHKEKTADDLARRRNATATSRPEIEAELADYITDGGFTKVADVGGDSDE